jgi:CRP/FNR family cyclic AMP-dependent transcriptional regulator
MNLEELHRNSPLFSDMAGTSISFLESIARDVSIDKDETIFRVNAPADRLYVVASGTVALRLAGPSGPPMTIQTLGEGSLVGLSWRLAPYRWQWTCEALTDSELTTFDANEVLSACEQDPILDADLWRIVAKESASRLHNVRLQLLDVYGKR